MRIAYIINSAEGGGAQTPLPKIVRALERAGAEVRILALSMRDGRALDRLVAAGVDFKVRDGGETDHRAAYRWVLEGVREWRAEVIWTSLTRATLVGQVIGQKLGLPVVSWQHNAFLKPWNERLLRWRADTTDVWVADSASVAALSVQRLGIAPERVVTWPIFAAEPGAPKATPWQPGQILQVGSLGRLHPNKGYDILIDAVAIMNAGPAPPRTPYIIKIAGTGADEAGLRARAKARNVHTIDFVGFVHDPSDYLTELHLYLQPSRREGFCIAAHEAMQA